MGGAVNCYVTSKLQPLCFSQQLISAHEKNQFLTVSARRSRQTSSVTKLELQNTTKNETHLPPHPPTSHTPQAKCWFRSERPESPASTNRKRTPKTGRDTNGQKRRESLGPSWGGVPAGSVVEGVSGVRYVVAVPRLMPHGASSADGRPPVALWCCGLRRRLLGRSSLSPLF